MVIIQAANYADWKALVNGGLSSGPVFYYQAGTPGLGNSHFVPYGFNLTNGSEPSVILTPDLSSPPGSFSTDFPSAGALTAPLAFPTSA